MSTAAQGSCDSTLDLCFLIERCLREKQFHRTAMVLQEEMVSSRMIPERYDWRGGKHKRTYEDWVQKHLNVDGDHLQRLCANLIPLLKQVAPQPLCEDPSLLRIGRYSLLRTAESVRQTKWTSKSFTASVNGRPVIPPHNLKPSNRFYHLKSRELGQKTNPYLALPISSMYGQIKMSLRCLGHLSAVYCVLFDRTGSKILTGSDDCLIKCWCAWSGKLLFSFRGHQAEICDMDVSYDNTLLASGSCNKVIRVWNLQSAAPVAVLQGHSAILTALEFSPVVDGDVGYLLSTGRDGNVCFWRWTVKDRIFSEQPIKFQERSRSGVSMLCTSWSGGGRFAVVGGSDSVIHVYYLPPALDAPVKLIELDNHTDKVDSIWFAHRGVRFASGSCDGTARIWRYERNEWNSIVLDVSKNTEVAVSGSSSTENTKLKVVMVAWDCRDNYVITSLTDFSIKVWRAADGELVSILKGHTDEAYCLEGHPSDPRILLSASHDGNVILWDIQACQQVIKYYNHLEGQGHGAVFDAKFSPTGDHIACTDSHGHIIIFSYGDGSAYSKVPEEQFFHTDYRPLIHDSFGAVLDEQTQQAPHRMPPPFLVDVDGNPHPTHLQRLVPGRENITSSGLLPVVEMVDNVVLDAAGDGGGEAEANGAAEGGGAADEAGNEMPSHSSQDTRQRVPSRIDEAIIRLQGEANGDEPSASMLASPTRNALLALRREGEVAGVRQMHSNAPRSHLASAAELDALCSRQLVPRTSPACKRHSDMRRAAEGDCEVAWYNREKQKLKKVPKKPTASEMAESLENQSKRMLRLALRSRTQERHRSEGVIEEQSDTMASRLRISRFVNPRHHYGTRSNVRRETDTEADDDSEQRLSSRNSNSDTSGGSSGDEVDSDVWQSPSNHDTETNRNRRTPGTSNRRRRANRFASNVSWGPDDYERVSEESEQEADVSTVATNGVLSKAKASRMSVRSNLVEASDTPFAMIPGTLPPDDFLPPRWIQQELPKPSPYLPQIGDITVYFRQGHELYLQAVSQKKLWNVGDDSDICFKTSPLRHMETCEVIEVLYEVGPPTLCFLKLLRIPDGDDEGEEDDESQRTFTLRFHDMPDVIDFLVLKEKYDASLKQGWKPGDRFRSIIDDAWWYGTVLSCEPLNPDLVESNFQSLLVAWDSEETERMSSWDLEPVPDCEESYVVTRSHQPQLKCGVPITGDEMNELFRAKQAPQEWWGEGVIIRHDNGLTGHELVDREISRICRGLETVIGCGMFFPFSGSVDLKIFPAYVTVVAFPTNLNLILTRLQNRFYRRMAALLWEVELLEKNASSFNEPDSSIVQSATLLVELLSKFICTSTCDDIEEMIEELRIGDRYTRDHTSSDGGTVSAPQAPRLKKVKLKKSKSKKKLRVTIRPEETKPLPNIDEWKRKCSELLSLVWDTEDAAPFRESIDEDEYPDYYEYIEKPMDFKMVRENLAYCQYENPKEVNQDLLLIFKNSKTYNTNKKSRIYSMTIRLQALVTSRMIPIIEDWDQAVAAHKRCMSKASTYERGMTRSLRSSMRNRKKLSPEFPLDDEQRPCSSSSLCLRRNATDSESSSGDDEADDEKTAKSNTSKYSPRLTRSRKRQRNLAILDESSDEERVPVKKERLEHQSNPPDVKTSPTLIGRRPSTSAPLLMKRTYEYDPDFEEGAPRNGIANESSSQTNSRQSSPSKQTLRRSNRERKLSAFISSCDGTSDEGGDDVMNESSTAQSQSGVDRYSDKDGEDLAVDSDFTSDPGRSIDPAHLRRSNRKKQSRRVVDEMSCAPSRSHAKSTRTTDRASTRTTRYRGQRTIRYAEMHSDVSDASDASDSGTSDFRCRRRPVESSEPSQTVSSRGRIRRLSTKALESRVC